MTTVGDRFETERPVDFFISYSPADERWASWIAWQLETTGHRTMMQAWDFVPGTNFIDFMDRGLSEAKVVIAVLSSNYLRSRYGRWEWMTALRADPDDPANKLITIRIEDCPIDGLLSTITYVDLVGIDDPAQARALLLRRVEEALAGSARPTSGPAFPGAEGRHQVISGRLEGEDPADPAPPADPPAVSAASPSPSVPPGSSTPPASTLAPPAPSTPAAGSASSSPAAPAPSPATPPQATSPAATPVDVPLTAGSRPRRRIPVSEPAYPVRVSGRSAPRDHISVLHVSGPRFGRTLADPDEPTSATELQDHIWSHVARMTEAGVPRPDLLVVSGNLTHSGSRKEFTEALSFLTSLRALLGLEAQRVIIVPGTHDVTRAACQAYFSSCEADDIEPKPPYWPKWRHFTGLFKEFYQGIDPLIFDSAQPWTLFPVPDLKVVVAGLNSTLAQTHRPEDRYGHLGKAQAAWFTEQLRRFKDEGWLRLAAVEHSPIAGEPGALRDAGDVDALLSGQINVFFQGTETDLGTIPLLSSGVPSVPALPTGRHQTIVITPEGLTRWIPEEMDRRGPERLERTWVNVGGTFPASRGEPQALSDASDDGTGDRDRPGATAEMAAEPQDPTLRLLDRIVETCETRFENAKIRRIAATPPHLLLTHLEDGFVRQYRIAAHVGRLTEADVDAFVQHVHADGTDHGSELVYQGPTPPRALRDDALRRGVRVRSFTEFQGLLDLSDYVAGQTKRLLADGPYAPSLYVPQRFRDLDDDDSAVRNDVVAEMLRLLSADHGRFLLLLGDFGRGKTFALRELARRIPTELPHIIPILIELRALDKAHSVDGLVAAHLANHNEDLIDLRAFNYMLRQGRIVLLFDGFDELVTRVTYDQAADHLSTLLEAAQGKAKIVVASRTQHFKSQKQVFTALGEQVGRLAHRRVLGLEDFDPAQVRSYLVNRYRSERTAETRLGILSGIDELLRLTANPRMLSFIADLPEERLRAVARSRETISPADLYEEILTSWLGYEAERVKSAGGPAGLSLDDMWNAVDVLAMRLWESSEHFLRLSELTDIAETLTTITDGRLSQPQMAHAVGAGSLFVRTSENLFGFIHNSVMEWLVARHIANAFASEPAPSALSHRPLSQLTVDFLCDLADGNACRQWARGVLADPDADDVARANAIKITTRLRTSAHTDLRGARLKGEDLSYRDLSGVDLTEADLTDAQLVGTNLSQAVLRGARLTGARLDDARLVGADLRDADLSRARLVRADLRDVHIEGSRWTRAAIIDARLPDRLRGAIELREAAIAPGRPTEVQVAPAVVGVPYGFHHQTSRLPRPLAYSPGGTLLAVGAEDGSVLICDAISNTPLRVLRGHRRRAYAVVFDTTGMLLASGSADGTVRLWDLATGTCAHVLEVHPAGVWPVVLAPDGTSLAVGTAAGTVQIWDTRDGRRRLELSGLTAPIYTTVFSPRDPLMVTGDAAGLLRIWDVTTGKLERTLPRHAGAVFRAVFSPDGSVLAAGDEAGTVQVWDMDTGEVRHELLGHSGRIYALDFHPDGELLAVGDTDGEVSLWDGGHRRRQLSGHTGAIYQTTFSRDGDRLATADSDGKVRLWDVRTGRLQTELTGHRGAVWPFAFSPDGANLATTSNDGTARIWDTGSGNCRAVLRGHGRRITSVTFSPDGGLLASGGNDGHIRIWDPRTGRLVRELSGTADNFVSATFNPADAHLAAATHNGGVHLWQPGTGTFERELDVRTEHVWAQTFSPNGSLLATANDDDSVRLWYWTTGRQVHNFADHRGRVRSIDFSPDGRLVATGCDDGAVRVWDGTTGDCITTLRGHSDRVYRVVFSPDGELLASASNDGTARLWDYRAGEVRRVFKGHQGRLWAADYSPAGDLIVTAGDDALVRLWDPRTGREVHVLSGHTRRIWSVTFDAAGSTLATAGDDGAIILWDIIPGETPRHRVTLLGLAEGWAALAPDGRYKWEGNAAGEFWYAVGMCRFEPGQLDPYLGDVRRLPLDQEF